MTFIAGPAVREVNQNPVGVAAKIVLPDREQMISPTRSTRRSTGCKSPVPISRGPMCITSLLLPIAAPWPAMEDGGDIGWMRKVPLGHTIVDGGGTLARQPNLSYDGSSDEICVWRKFSPAGSDAGCRP